MVNKTKEIRGFYEDLCENVKNKENEVYGDILKYCPSFFKLLCKILEDERSDWHTRLTISAALAYFVVPNDIIPEEMHGVIGYVDDIFICSYVLRDIKNKVSEKLLTDHWDGKEDILELVDNVYNESRRIMGEKSNLVLKFSGLRKEGNTPTIKDNKMFDRLLLENQELLCLLAYVTRLVFDRHISIRKIKLPELRDFLLSQDSSKEIQKIMQIMKQKNEQEY